MRILFLDDNHDRHKLFGRRSIGCKVDKAYTAQEAIAFLERIPSSLDGETEYDLVMLDHDLGGPESENQMFDDAEDGRMVARWIAENPDRFGDTTFVIHSLNANGREAMAAIIGDAGLVAHKVPFGWDKFVYNENGVRFF